MNSHKQRQQQEQPRRILEKSRTVRRRYQRSNKRLEFTPSQIQRIEREEERERKAQQLRDKEKRKLANKKKKAEKEAKEREERRRLGIPDPNAVKIPASQPLLMNFFVLGNKAEQADEVAEDGECEECCVSTEHESAETVQQEDIAAASTETFSDVDTEFGDDWLDDIFLDEQIIHKETIHEPAHESALSAPNASSVPHHNEQATASAQSIEGRPTIASSFSDSFEDDTALLLQTLDPSILQTLETTQKPQLSLHSGCTAMNNIQRNVTPSMPHLACTARRADIAKPAAGARIWNGRSVISFEELKETKTAPPVVERRPRVAEKETVHAHTNQLLNT